jgi:TonB family protein
VTFFLAISTLIHAAVAAGLIFILPAIKPEKKYYVIDFMGGQSGLGPGKMEPAPAPAGGQGAGPVEPAKTEPLPDTVAKDPQKIAVKKEPAKSAQKEGKTKGKEGAPKAPRDKGMKGGRGVSADGKGDIHGTKSGPVGGAGTSLEIGGFGPGGGVKAGPRFPYQWYIQTVYKRLWENWDRADAGNRECGVIFTILRDGMVKDVRVDESSGDGYFDLTARRAVENAAPFPPLPEGFTEPNLRVFVKFRLQ